MTRHPLSALHLLCTPRPSHLSPCDSNTSVTSPPPDLLARHFVFSAAVTEALRREALTSFISQPSSVSPPSLPSPPASTVPAATFAAPPHPLIPHSPPALGVTTILPRRVGHLPDTWASISHRTMNWWWFPYRKMGKMLCVCKLHTHKETEVPLIYCGLLIEPLRN